jgi:hypothetical protein
MPDSSIHEKLANEGKDLKLHIVNQVKDMYQSAFAFLSEGHFCMVDAAVASHFSSFILDYEIVDIIDAAVVDQSQILFSSFHSFVMKAVDVSKSALSPSQPKLSRNFYQWDSCNFHGEESLEEVCTRLKFPNVSITSYFKFVEHIPMLNLLFHGYHLYRNLYSVALLMSFDAFTRYLHQTSCHIDYEVE